MQIDNGLTAASYQEATSCRYTARWYAQVVTYGSESWTLTMEEERTLAVFERKILRKIYGPVNEKELWRIQRNDELEVIIKGENIVRFVKCQRIRWLGHKKECKTPQFQKRCTKSCMQQDEEDNQK